MKDLLVWDNGLYSVNYILNKWLLASSQAGSIGGITRQKVEAGRQEQEYSGKRILLSAVPPATEEARCDCPAK